MNNRKDLVYELILPALLFAALGGMTWAVRGSSGFGAVKGCVFAGVTWGAAWWFISLEPGDLKTRRYSSGWIILALTVGIGISGNRGWMQWPSFFEGKLLTNYAKGEFVPISKAYGFRWLFLAGVPWAGLGACLLAWCGSGRPLRAWEWAVRVACGFAMAWVLGDLLFNEFPRVFLPLYDSLRDRYQDLQANPNLRRLIGDNHLAMRHLGLYLGFLLFEAGRKDWRNMKLILTVGLLNGCGWAFCQNWKWAPGLWPHAHVNWWRCWESSGGISIGLAYGVAFYLVNRPMTLEQKARVESASPNPPPYRVWLSGFALMLVLAFFMRAFLQRPELENRGGLWANAGNVYLIIAIVYGLAGSLGYRMTSHVLSDQERAARLASARPDLDWLAVWFSLLTIFGVLLSGELREWRGWFIQGAAHQWSSYLYAAMLAAFALGAYANAERVSTAQAASTNAADSNFERLAVYLGLLLGLGLSVKNGLRGWANIYPVIFPEGERYWGEVFWSVVGPLMLLGLAGLLVWHLSSSRRNSAAASPVLFRQAPWLIALVLLVQNIIAQMITGPWSNPRELQFNVYYLALFFLSTAIVFRLRANAVAGPRPDTAPREASWKQAFPAVEET